MGRGSNTPPDSVVGLARSPRYGPLMEELLYRAATLLNDDKSGAPLPHLMLERGVLNLRSLMRNRKPKHEPMKPEPVETQNRRERRKAA
jgi:hypothetical protein